MMIKRSSLSFFFTHDKSQLFQASFLMLFVELTIIRWTGSNVLNIFFFSNLVLIASFLGIGIGFLRAKSSFNSFYFSPVLLMIVIFFCYYFSFEYQATVIKETDNLDYNATFFKDNAFPVWFSLPILFLVVTALMATIADGVSRNFQKFLPLQAYRLEVLGSLSGIIIFSILSFLHAPPLYWGVIISLIYVSLLFKQWQLNNFLMIFLQIASLIIIVVTFGNESNAQDYFWSSYYKITLKKYSGNRYVVNVNGLAQQIIETIAQRKKVKPFYFLPYQHSVQQPLKNILVIGAGTGGDVAIALAQGAEKIDAVEIDPVLYDLGKKLDPNLAYYDRRVHVTINDGRAFLQQNTDKYDMIIFALTDSLMLLPQSTLRLENYLYTLESFEAVSKHLKPDGIFTIYNYYRPHWLIDRLANTLAFVFKHPPCLDTFTGRDYWATVLTISPKLASLQCPTLWHAVNDPSATPATDNHPFVYLENNTISMSYIIFLLFIIFVSLSALKITGGSYHSIKTYLDLFLMGAAFLLLETKNIINFALLFGSTWFVNALVFIGILMTVYLAIEFANYTTRLKPILLYFLLIATLFLAWLIPNSYFLSLPVFLRFIAATLLAFSPIFIANLLFSDRFRKIKYSQQAFGVNLIGAVFGGLLEYSAILLGYRNLLSLTIILYTIAILFMIHSQRKVENLNLN